MVRLYSACTGQNVAPVRDDIARQCNAQLIIDSDGVIGCLCSILVSSVR